MASGELRNYGEVSLYLVFDAGCDTSRIIDAIAPDGRVIGSSNSGYSGDTIGADDGVSTCELPRAVCGAQQAGCHVVLCGRGPQYWSPRGMSDDTRAQ